MTPPTNPPATPPATPRTTDLPPPRAPGTYAVAIVCLGNICRSPIADVVLATRLAEAGLDDRVVVHSCGTGGWHVGQPMDARAAATLRAAGLDPSRHRAQQFDDSWLAEHDLVLAMDATNLADVGGRSDRVRLLRDFDPAVSPADGDSGDSGDDRREVPDPYYGGADGFEEVLAMVERSCATLVASLATGLASGLAAAPDDVSAEA